MYHNTIFKSIKGKVKANKATNWQFGSLVHAGTLALLRCRNRQIDLLLGIELVCDAVVKAMNHPTVAPSACSAISKLAFWTRFANRIGQSGGCFEVVSFFHKALVEDVQDHASVAAQALQMLVCDDLNNRSTLAVPKTARPPAIEVGRATGPRQTPCALDEHNGSRCYC